MAARHRGRRGKREEGEEGRRGKREGGRGGIRERKSTLLFVYTFFQRTLSFNYTC